MLALPGGIVTSTLTFTAAGTYTFTVYATDADGATTTSTVTVVVQQTLTAISVQTPSPPPLSGGSDFFQTGGTDQFGNPMSPGGATYAVTSGTVSGSTNPPGVRFTAPPGITAPETDTITMTDGTFTKTITVSVTPPASNMGAWGPGSSPVSYTGTISGTDATGHDFSRNITVPMDLGQVSLGSGQSGSVTASGTISWTFAWQSAQNSPPPSVSYFAVSGGVTGSNYDSGMGGSGSPTADDGFGDPQQDTYGTSGQVTSASSGGTRLFKEGGSSSVTVATKTFTSTSSGGVGMDESGLLEAGYGFSAGPIAAPSVAVLSPGSGSVIQAGGDVTATVKADLSVNGNSSNALLSLSLKVQGGTGGGGGDMTPDANGYASLDLGTLAAGTYTLTAVAKYDNGDAPLEVDSQPVTFTVASFTVKTESWSPNPAAVSQIISGQVQGVFDPTSVDGGGSGPTFVVYTWSTAGVWYSQDGTAGTFEPYGGDGIVEWQQGTADTTFHAQFFTPGQYLLEVVCTASVYSQSTGLPVATFTGTGYIGGSASDIDTSGGGTGHARVARGRVAHLASGGAGITVVPATVTFSDTSIKLGLGAPTAYQKILTAVVTPGYEINSISFTALNTFGGPSDEVSVLTDTENLATGVVKLLVTATSFTPPETGGTPDCVVVATVKNYVGATTLASATALVLKPWDFTESPTSGIAKPTNKYFLPAGPNNNPPASTIPLDWGISTPSAGHVYFATHEEADVVITITDQFGNNLDPIYDGFHVVHETFAGDPLRQNVPITFPEGLLTNGQIKDAIEINQADDITDTGKTLAQEESNWGGFHQLLSGAAGGKWDNAIAGNLVKDLVLPDLEQSITVYGIVVAGNVWTRSIFLYKKDVIHHNNDLDGTTMSYTKTPMF